MTWQDRAECKGRPGPFYPPHGERNDARIVRVARAKAICNKCQVISRCKAFARDEQFGIWAGETEAERGWVGVEFPVRRLA